MADYKEMYLEMMRESEKAIRILVEAQRKCEEMYMMSPDLDIKLTERDRKPGDDMESECNAD